MPNFRDVSAYAKQNKLDVTPDIYRMGIQVSFTEATAESAMNRSVLMPLMLMTMLSYSCLPLSV